MLGSLPGERSLADGQYYAHPRNQFWPLMSRVVGTDLVTLNYEDRLAALLAARVGLWDTVASARREGSLDGAIRDAEHAPLPHLAGTLPQLRAVAFNGKTAQRIGMAQLEGSGLDLIALPSSSPAYAAIGFEQKAERWDALRRFLN